MMRRRWLEALKCGSCEKGWKTNKDGSCEDPSLVLVSLEVSVVLTHQQYAVLVVE